jgi:ABC-type antimicrobial peptide transport system ATPase subunit
VDSSGKSGAYTATQVLPSQAAFTNPNNCNNVTIATHVARRPRLYASKPKISSLTNGTNLSILTIHGKHTNGSNLSTLTIMVNITSLKSLITAILSISQL